MLGSALNIAQHSRYLVQFQVLSIGGLVRKSLTLSLALIIASGVASSPADAVTSGPRLGPKDVYVLDENDQPITGGAVTWKMADGSARSARSYGLTADGLITFPYAPTGDAVLSISGAGLASGDKISGSYDITLTAEGAQLQLANAPAHEHSVRVEGPDGGGVAGAVVTLPTSCAGDVWDPEKEWIDGDWDADGNWVDGHYEGGFVAGTASTTLTTALSNEWGNYGFDRASQTIYVGAEDDEVYQATTDSNGNAKFFGYAEKSECTEVSVEYNDGVVIQNAKGELDSTVTLPYVPVITIQSEDITAHSGAAVAIPVSVMMPTGNGLARSKFGIRSASRLGVQTTVSIRLPRGAARGSCGARLSAQTNSAGRATLKVCATASGIYRIQAKGSLQASGVMIRVKGAPATPVTSVTVRSKTAGEASASWNPPTYLGGARLLGYQVVVKKNGSVVRRINLAADRRSLTVHDLDHAQTYTFSVTAKTKYGLSQFVTKAVGVV